MCTVLITYSTPPPAEPRRQVAEGDVLGTPVDPATASVESTTAGIDEAIAATIADELSLAGHQVTCRPCVATPVTGGFDLVVDVDRLQVTHRGPSARRSPPLHRDRLPSPDRQHDGESTIPLTWGADWRAVDAWARTVGDGLARYLELRSELTRVRAELEQCRALLHAATAPHAADTPPVPPAQLTPLVEAPRLARREPGHGRHRHHRLEPVGTSREP